MSGLPAVANNLFINLDQAKTFYMGEHVTAEELQPVYLTGEGRAYTCNNCFEWIVQVILDFFFDYKIANICSVFQSVMFEYMLESQTPITKEHTVEVQEFLLDQHRERLDFIVELLHANKTAFDRYAPQGSALRNAYNNFIGGQGLLPAEAALTSEKAQLTEKVASLMLEKTELRAKNQSLQAAVALTENNVAQLLQEKTKEHEEAEFAKEHCRTLVQKLDEMFAKKEALRIENEKLTQQLANLQNKIGVLPTDKIEAGIDGEARKAVEETAKLKQNYSRLLEAFGGFETALGAAQKLKHLKELTKENEALKTANAKLLKEHDEIAETIKVERAENGRLSAKLFQVTGKPFAQQRASI